MSSNGYGFLISCFFIAAAAFLTDSTNPLQFLNLHGAFIVLIGTAVIAIISVPWSDIKNFFPMIRVVCKQTEDDTVEVISQIVDMAERARVDMATVQEYVPKIKDPFLRDSVQILLEGFDMESIQHILRRRIEVQRDRETANAKMFKNLGKYPPATGLLGTVMGMIAILSSLGQEGANEKVGPAMAIALSATLYGIVVANLVILPVADYLIFRTLKSTAKREMVIEGILLIKQKTSPVMVREILISHLTPGQRQIVSERRAASRQAAA